MNRSDVLTIRRAVNQQRRAGHTEKAIAAWLTASKLAPPTGDAWRRAGVGPTWSAQGVTRFMECTANLRGVIRSAAPPRASAPPTGAAHKAKAPFIRTAAPTPP